jgi:hypothetical protein
MVNLPSLAAVSAAGRADALLVHPGHRDRGGDDERGERVRAGIGLILLREG